jgi:AcrR family transcriptional regulator
VSSGAGTTTSRRERQRQATLDEIVGAARELLTEPGGLSLRAVAQKVGMTAPALYRYVASYQDLVALLAQTIDEETAALLREARDTQPDDDPVAQIVCASAAFRRWALSHREEFGVVFANPAVPPVEGPETIRDPEVGMVFTDLLLAVWRKHQFPVPGLDELDPAVVSTFSDPVAPVRVEAIPQESLGLLWVITQSWMVFYGTVTLEVFGHCDPRIIGSGALFRAMLAQQAELLGIAGELPRLQPKVDEWLQA